MPGLAWPGSAPASSQNSDEGTKTQVCSQGPPKPFHHDGSGTLQPATFTPQTPCQDHPQERGL